MEVDKQIEPEPEEDNASPHGNLRVCIGGRWATDEEIAVMLAKGAERAARRRAEGVIP